MLVTAEGNVVEAHSLKRRLGGWRGYGSYGSCAEDRYQLPTTDPSILIVRQHLLDNKVFHVRCPSFVLLQSPTMLTGIICLLGHCFKHLC
jgi:hypothetical protein